MMLGYGAIIVAQCDNLIRFLLQKKMADVHPLITIFGVVAGLPLFGFMGIILALYWCLCFFCLWICSGKNFCSKMEKVNLAEFGWTDNAEWLLSGPGGTR